MRAGSSPALGTKRLEVTLDASIAAVKTSKPRLSSLYGDRKLKEERPGVTGCKHTPALYAFVMELVDIPD